MKFGGVAFAICLSGGCFLFFFLKKNGDCVWKEGQPMVENALFQIVLPSVNFGFVCVCVLKIEFVFCLEKKMEQILENPLF